MTERVEVGVWKGAAALEPFLVPLDDLEPFPGNPRRGDVAQVRASLRRFGQVRPILADGRRIVAGHHVVGAAREEGWTHVAAIPHEFGDENEARAYLLADNRLPELGGYDDALLLAQLDAVRDDLDGTGYSAEDVRDLDARVGALAEPSFAESDPGPRLDERSAPAADGFEVPLLLGREERRDFAQRIRMLEREWGVSGVTAVVVRAVYEASLRVA